MGTESSWKTSTTKSWGVFIGSEGGSEFAAKNCGGVARSVGSPRPLGQKAFKSVLARRGRGEEDMTLTEWAVEIASKQEEHKVAVEGMAAGERS